MKRKYTLELLEEYERVNIYSIKENGEELTKFESFLLRFNKTHPKDVGVIMYRIERITNKGVFERHFRYAGKMKDHVVELPSHLDTSKLRLYCLCLSENIIIIGNGDIKRTRTYNVDPILNDHVKVLQQIDKKINQRLRNGEIVMEGRVLSGKLIMTIEI